MRKLATIRMIKEINPIDGADKIEIAIVDGWQCIVKKGEFKPGDMGVYYEIDSFLPLKPEYEFLKNNIKTMADGSKGYRLRTITMKGELSQGLLLRPDYLKLVDSKIGDDVTDILEIKKFEAPVPASLGGDAKGTLPGGIKTTDQERIQNLTEYFERYKDVYFEESEKLDGTSSTFFYLNGETGVCGRNFNFCDTPKNSYWKIAKRMELIEKLMCYKRNIAIQGELIGEGIQKNRYKLIGQNLMVFDIWDIDNQCYFSKDERLAILEELGIDYTKNHVPIIGEPFKVFEKYPTMNELLNHANGKSLLADTLREGFVYKSVEKINKRIVSFKVISNQFLNNHRE